MPAALPAPATPQILLAGGDAVAMTGWLREAGCIVRSAGSMLAALRLAAGRPRPDLVLVNELVGDQDGLALVRRLKDDPRLQDLPVLFVGGAEGPMDEELALALGAADCLALPLRPLVLLARVRNLLGPRARAAAGVPAGLEAWLQLAQARDAGLALRLRRVQAFTRRLVQEAAADPALGPQVAAAGGAALVEAAALYDLGMLALPDRLLDPVGPLAPAEAAQWRRHPRLGAEIIERAARACGAAGPVLERAWEAAC